MKFVKNSVLQFVLQMKIFDCQIGINYDDVMGNNEQTTFVVNLATERLVFIYLISMY